MACDVKVIRPLRDRALGNGAFQLARKIEEQHSERWMHQTNSYLTDVQAFRQSPIFKLSTLRSQKLPDLPPIPKVPSYQWYLDVYARDLEQNLPHLKAEITSTFGSILKMDSTKKVSDIGVKWIARPITLPW